MAAVPSLKKSCAVMKNSVPYGFSNGIVMRSVAKGVCVPSSPLVSIHCGHWGAAFAQICNERASFSQFGLRSQLISPLYRATEDDLIAMTKEAVVFSEPKCK
jgi:hypothetical protein